jgi:hypothetical protein
VGGEVLRHDVALLAFESDLVVERVTVAGEHTAHEVVERGERLRRRGLQLRLERLPLRLPLAAIEARLHHGRNIAAAHFKPPGGDLDSRS